MDLYLGLSKSEMISDLDFLISRSCFFSILRIRTADSQQLPGVDFHAVQGCAESLPFPAAEFDAVVGSLVMCSLDLWRC